MKETFVPEGGLVDPRWIPGGYDIAKQAWHYYIPETKLDKTLEPLYAEKHTYGKSILETAFESATVDKITFDDLPEMTFDEAYDHANNILQESKMQVYDYVIVRANKKGELREILEYDRILAQTEEKAKLTALAQHIKIQGEDREVDLDRLEVLVRPF